MIQDHPESSDEDSTDQKPLIPGHLGEHDEYSGPGLGAGRGKPTGPPTPAGGKKTKGRVKIKMEFIDNKLRRYTTFSKRKTGIMKKVRDEPFVLLTTKQTECVWNGLKAIILTSGVQCPGNEGSLSIAYLLAPA